MSTDARPDAPVSFVARIDAFLSNEAAKAEVERARNRDLAMLHAIAGDQRKRAEQEHAPWRCRLRDLFTLRGARVRELERRVTWLESECRRLLDDIREVREGAARPSVNRAVSNSGTVANAVWVAPAYRGD